VYAIPYEGEEVKLHWANHDQYYIKSSEYLKDYAFKLPDGKRVHFKLVSGDAEKDNTKAASGQERRFILKEDNFLDEREDELFILFEFRPDADKRKQGELNDLAVKRVLEAPGIIQKWPGLGAPFPTQAKPGRSLLEKHLADYTAKNTFDYFIHKDLGGFLRRELDFYIKNEVMHLDDIESQTAPKVEQYLSRIKVIREIAHKIIAFLAQIEDFQKKIWLKKKFVVETNYCITIDRVPEELYPEIAANEAQREEWVRLFAIDEIKAGQRDIMFPKTPGYTKPLSVEFLRANDKLVLDTRFFDDDFKTRLIASIDNLDEQCDGLLIHSENFQALNLMQERYRGQVKCVYIDPPYNTEQDRQQGKFIYKDNFESSSWIALMYDRISYIIPLMSNDSTFFSSIDHNEIASIKYLLETIFGKNNFEGLISWRRRHNQPNDKTKMIGMVAEFIISFAKNQEYYKKTGVGKLDLTGDFSNPDNDPRGDWASKPWKAGSDQSGSRYKIETPTGKILCEEWMGEEATYKQLLADGRIFFPKNGDGNPRKKYYRFEREEEGQ
ncbi:MAG: DNA methyltransferase, partial [Desulfatibacillaceae bacterium]|nr:DNA methyltransferase [Desulfatibacillaceae bacterium]